MGRQRRGEKEQVRCGITALTGHKKEQAVKDIFLLAAAVVIGVIALKVIVKKAGDNCTP